MDIKNIILFTLFTAFSISTSAQSKPGKMMQMKPMTENIVFSVKNVSDNRDQTKTILVEAQSSGRTEMINWVVDPKGKKSGIVVAIPKGTTSTHENIWESKLRTSADFNQTRKLVEFEDSFLAYTETMDAISNTPKVEHIVLQIKNIKKGKAKTLTIQVEVDISGKKERVDWMIDPKGKTSGKIAIVPKGTTSTHENIWESKLRTANPNNNQPKGTTSTHENIWESKLIAAGGADVAISNRVEFEDAFIVSYASAEDGGTLNNASMTEHISNQDGVDGDNSKRRMIAAKLLVELDKTPKANNWNNGRSNKDRCCSDGLMAPSNYQVLAFGLSTTWFLFQEGVGDVDIPNPIPFLQSITPNWDVALYDDKVEIISNKAVFIQDNELLLSIDNLADGRYFIEIAHEENLYATGFTIGDAVPMATGDQNDSMTENIIDPTKGNDPMTENRVARPVANDKKRPVTAELLKELDNIPKANNRNNGRQCCCPGCFHPKDRGVAVGTELYSFNLNSQWVVLDLVTKENIAIPNPIPYLGAISSSWSVSLYKENMGFMHLKTAYIGDYELLISIDSLSIGKYFIEIEHNGDYYATGFSIGNSGGTTKPAKGQQRH